jgi:hypothetical protein
MKKIIVVLVLVFSLSLVYGGGKGELVGSHFWDCSGMGCDATVL